MKSYFKFFSPGIVLLLTILVFAGCQKEEITLPQDNAAIEQRADIITGGGLSSTTTIYGLSAENEIVTFSFGPPVIETSSMPIIGTKPGEKIMAIDMRRTTGQLYGISNFSVVYVIDPKTGVSTLVSGIPFFPALTGTMVGMDFSYADQIRVVTDTDQNMRIDPRTGAVVFIDRPISPGSASVNAIAYKSGSASSFGPILFDINTSDGGFYYQSETRGNLIFIGKTGLTISGEGGFDISGNTALAFLYARGTHNIGNTDKTNDWTVDAHRLYSINLRTGLATQFGMVRPMVGIAIQ